MEVIKRSEVVREARDQSVLGLQVASARQPLTAPEQLILHLQRAAGNRAVVEVMAKTFVQRSPLSESVAAVGNDKGHVFDILRARGPISPQDSDLVAWLDGHFPSGTDDRWLADQLAQYGSEPHWPSDALITRQQRARDHGWAPEPGNIEGQFSVGAGKEPVKAYFFPGTSDRRAMIIGGVHGSEAAGVEVVNMLLAQLRRPGARMPLFSVIVVPVLFTENLAHHRRVTPGHVDPNRQMPAVGSTPGTTDSEGRPIEPENLVLLDLIERFRPERIASAHGHSPPRPGHTDMPSITDDPRPGHEAEDDRLALDMARGASSVPGGARVPGNRLGTPDETSRYPTSSAAHQPGVSFGEYGSHPAGSRPAMNVVTIETFDNYTSAQAGNATSRGARRVELESIATVLNDIFLNRP